MALRFFRRIRIAPGISINLSKSGASLSLGGRGARVTIGRRGVRRTIGIPGTGLFYTTTTGGGKKPRRARTGRTHRRRSAPGAAEVSATPERPEDRLTLSFFDRLLMPKKREHLIDGLRELLAGREKAALRHLGRADRCPDAAFLAGLLALKHGRLAEAEVALKLAGARPDSLGRDLQRLGVRARVTLAVTRELSLVLEPSPRGVLLALVEVYQRQQRFDDAIRCLRRLLRREPNDLLARISLAELLYDRRADAATCRRILELVPPVQNRSLLHATALLYRARALRGLGLHTAARDVLTTALRRTRDRPAELLRALRYERALVYEALGQSRRARREFERIFAECPGYADVRRRLLGEPG